MLLIFQVAAISFSNLGLESGGIKNAEAASFNFTITVTDSTEYVDQGGSTIYKIRVQTTSGDPQTVTLTVAGLSSDGLEYSFYRKDDGISSWLGKPNPAFDATLYVMTSDSTPPDDYPFTIKGEGGGVTKNAPAKLVVQGGNLDGRVYDLEVDPPEVEPGDEVEITASIENTGDVKADYRLYTNDEVCTGMSDLSDTITLDPDDLGSVNLVCDTSSGQSPGVYEIDVWFAMAYYGSGWEDEEKAGSVTISIEGTEPGTINVEITNEDDESVFVIVFVDGEEKHRHTGLASGQTYTFPKIGVEGDVTHNVMIRWTDSGDNKQYDKDDDVYVAGGGSKSVSFTVDYHQLPVIELPDLNIYGIELDSDDDSYEAGQEIVISPKIKNEGDIEAKNFDFDLYVDGDYIDTFYDADLASGQTTSNYYLKWIAEEGKHTLKIVLDPNEDIEESDGDDNEYEVEVKVEQKKCDLDVSVSPNDKALKKGESATFEIRVENESGCADHKVSLFLDSPSSIEWYFDPPTRSPSFESRLVIITSTDMKVDDYTLEVQAESEDGSFETAKINLEVEEDEIIMDEVDDDIGQSGSDETDKKIENIGCYEHYKITAQDGPYHAFWCRDDAVEFFTGSYEEIFRHKFSSEHYVITDSDYQVLRDPVRYADLSLVISFARTWGDSEYLQGEAKYYNEAAILASSAEIARAVALIASSEAGHVTSGFLTGGTSTAITAPTRLADYLSEAVETSVDPSTIVKGATIAMLYDTAEDFAAASEASRAMDEDWEVKTGSIVDEESIRTIYERVRNGYIYGHASITVLNSIYREGVNPLIVDVLVEYCGGLTGPGLCDATGMAMALKDGAKEGSQLILTLNSEEEYYDLREYVFMQETAKWHEFLLNEKPSFEQGIPTTAIQEPSVDTPDSSESLGPDVTTTPVKPEIIDLSKQPQIGAELPVKKDFRNPRFMSANIVISPSMIMETGKTSATVTWILNAEGNADDPINALSDLLNNWNSWQDALCFNSKTPIEIMSFDYTIKIKQQGWFFGWDDREVGVRKHVSKILAEPGPPNEPCSFSYEENGVRKPVTSQNLDELKNVAVEIEEIEATKFNTCEWLVFCGPKGTYNVLAEIDLKMHVSQDISKSGDETLPAKGKTLSPAALKIN